MWKREEDLGHAKELVEQFEGRVRTEVRRQERVEARWNMKTKLRADKFRRTELSGRYMAKLLYGWDNGKFEAEYLKKLEKNWQKWKLVSLEKKS